MSVESDVGEGAVDSVAVPQEQQTLTPQVALLTPFGFTHTENQMKVQVDSFLHEPSNVEAVFLSAQESIKVEYFFIFFSLHKKQTNL